MSEPTEDFLAPLATRPWRPQSLRSPRPESLSFRWRVVTIFAIALLHVLLARWLMQLVVEDTATEEVLWVLDFTEPPPAVKPATVPLSDVAPRVKPIKPKRKPKPVATPAQPGSVTPSAPATEIKLQPAPSAREHDPLSGKASTELLLYDSEGRVRLPDGMLDQIDKQLGDQRVFSYQIPKIDDAKKYFYRNPALAYQTTRFEQYWTPDQDALTELLTKLVEKTTKEVRIPVPGHPKSTMVCKVSILALGGGCGILTNGWDYVGPVDDPDTLNAEEDRQCQAWWNQIVGAKTQDVWRKTRSLYEAQCRKPLLRLQ